MDSTLFDRLAGVNRERGRLKEPIPRSPAPSMPRRSPVRLEDVLPGEEIRTSAGSCWRHDRPLDRLPGIDPSLPGRIDRRIRDEPPMDLAHDRGLRLWQDLGFHRGMFLDLETTGFSATPVFLAGLLKPAGPGMTFRLLFARNYREERALLEAVGREMEENPVLVTYNGKSYDVPFLRERTGRLRVPGAVPAAVLDLVHPARRRWKKTLPDCRLTTLETVLCGRKRQGDVDGRSIPDLYHRFVRTGDPVPLIPVFRHNLLDLYTLMEVTERVLHREPEPDRAGRKGTKRPKNQTNDDHFRGPVEGVLAVNAKITGKGPDRQLP